MKSRPVLVAFAAVAALATSALTAPGATVAAPAAASSSSAVTEWNHLAIATLTALPGPAGGAPPAAQVHVAMVQGAVYDAVNAIGPRHREPYLLKKRFPGIASMDAAVATAAYGVLHGIVSTAPGIAPATRSTTLATLESRYADALAAVPAGGSRTFGVRAGEAAAGAMLQAREGDGRFGPSPWVSNPAPGHWQPSIDPVSGLPVLDPTGWVADVDPFVGTSPSQFRTSGPVALTSETWAAELNEVKELGRVDSTVRTPQETYMARYWQSTPVALWNPVARELAMREGLGTRAYVRLLALQNFAGADAAIGCWNDKYHWDFWRPGNAVRRAHEDGNPATEQDPTWSPLIAAPYPDHPSGHLCLDGAHTRVLQMYFGDVVEGGYAMRSGSTLLQPGDPRDRTFGSFSEVLAEITEARIWAGLHYRTADVQGKELGQAAADYAADHFSGALAQGD